MNVKTTCDTCIHNRVCNVQESFKNIKVDNPHPYAIVDVHCTEYIKRESTIKDVYRVIGETK